MNSNVKSGAAYIRVSTHMQDELSPDAQRRLLLEYAQANGIYIPKEYIFIEKGISGKKADKRPEFMRMISSAKLKPVPFHVILVWKFSRFARNQEESIVYKSLLRKQCGIDVISVSEPIIEGPFGSLIERIIEWMDEYYSIRLSGEVIRGMTEKALKGGYQTRPPLGYRIACPKEAPVVVPEEARIVRLIFDKFVNGHMSAFDIARYLNSLGLRTNRGNPFEKRAVLYILQNPVYIGKIRWNRSEGATNRIKDKEEWIIRDGDHTPIIPAELFESAGRRLNADRNGPQSRPSSTRKHWLSGIIKCSSCGRTLSASQRTDKTNNKVYWNFQCCGYQKGKCSISHQISEKKLVPVLAASLEEAVKEDSIDYRFQSKSSNNQDRSIMEHQLYKLKRKEARIKEAYISGTDTLEEYKCYKEILQSERNALEELLKTCPETAEPSDCPVLPDIHSVYYIITGGDFTIQQKNEAMKSIIKHIVYSKDTSELEVYYYLRGPL